MAATIGCKRLDKTNVKKFIDSFDTVLTDCDGVIYHGSKAVPGAAETVHKLKKLGKRFFYVTNNSMKTRREFLQKITGLGFPASEEDIVASGYVTAQTLQTKYKFRGKAYTLGSPSLAWELSQVGVTAVGIGPDTTPMKDIEQVPIDNEVKCVIVGFDEHISYAKVAMAMQYLRRKECLFVSTNTDTGLPGASGRLLPGCGSILAMVTTASQRQPDVICGKPHQAMFDVLMNKYHLEPHKTLMIGDRLDTDILLAGRCGLQSLLVLSGFSSLEEVKRKQLSSSLDDKQQIPQFYLPSLADLDPLLGH